MADVIEVKINGLREAQAVLDNMSAYLRAKEVRRWLMKAAEPFVKSAKSRAPVLQNPLKHPRRQAGTLKRNIRAFRSKKFSGANGVLGVYVSVRASKADLKRAPITGDPYYFRWVEAGHRIVPRSRKIGVYRGRNQYALTITERRRMSSSRVPPYSFLGTAFVAAGETAARVFEAEAAAYVNRVNQGKT